MKKVVLAAIAFFIVLAFSPWNVSLGATNADIQAQIDAITKQQQVLLEQQKQLEGQLNATAAQKQTLQNAINTLNLSKKKLQNDLKITTSNINSTTLKLEKITSNISDNEAAITVHQAGIASALRKLSTYDDYPLVMQILSSKTISDAWSDVSSLKSTEDSLREEIDALNNAQKDLSKNKSAAESQKTNLISYQAQLKGQQQVIDESANAKAKLLLATKNQEAAYQKLLADNLAQEKAFEDQLFKFQEQLKAAPSSDAPDPKHGLLDWPLASIRITQQFGRTADSVRLYASGTHSGTDFGAAVGTAVMSMGDGVVGGMGNTDDEKGCLSYGRWLFVNYDNGLSSIYGHLSSIIVKTGDKVQAGQIVGYSGGQPGVYGSGYATGPHLHVGLFNSAGVSIQQYTSSIGCKQVSIPLANPTDYLDPMSYLPRL